MYSAPRNSPTTPRPAQRFPANAHLESIPTRTMGSTQSQAVKMLNCRSGKMVSDFRVHIVMPSLGLSSVVKKTTPEELWTIDGGVYFIPLVRSLPMKATHTSA